MRFIKAYVKEHGDIDLAHFPQELHDNLVIDHKRRRVDIASRLAERALREFDRLGIDAPAVEPVGLLPVPTAPAGGPITAVTGGEVAERHALSATAAAMMANVINCTVTIAVQDPASRAKATGIVAFKEDTISSFEQGMKYCFDAKEYGDAAVTPEAEAELAQVFARDTLLAPFVTTAQDRAFAMLNPDAAQVAAGDPVHGPQFQQAMAAAMPEIAAILAEEEDPAPVPDDPAAQLQAAMGGAQAEIMAIIGEDDEPEEEPAPAPRRAKRPRGQAGGAQRRAPRRRAAAAPADAPVAPPQIGDAPTEPEAAAAAEGMAELASLFTPEMLAMIGDSLKD
jgi:hypothetical protein